MVEAGEMAGLPHNRQDSLGKSGSNTNGKLGPGQGTQPHQPPIQPPPLCPECGNKEVYRDGMRYLSNGESVQRWLCKSCGHCFSESKVQVDVLGKVSVLHSGSELLKDRVVSGKLASQESFNGLPLSSGEDVVSHRLTTVGKGLNTFAYNSCNRRVSVSEGEAKNLAMSETRQEKPTREGTTQTVDVKGLIIQFMAWCEAQGYPQGNKYHHYLKRLVRLGANLLDPESVKETIGKHRCKNGTKMLFVYAYDAFTRMLKITWEPPKYKQEETLPFVPEEGELDALISACRGKRMAAFLQCLKETYADPGEVLGLRWIDISDNIITINKPVKGHLPGQIQVSNKVLAMLNSLPKTSERIFPARYDNMWKCFSQVRKRAAALQQNPRLLAIQFRSFRHWGGSMIAHYTNGNVLTVKKLLRHKRIENTMKYISMIHFKDDEFEVTTATTIEEAKQILSAGFDYVTQKDSIMLFRRPKRFR